MPHGRMKPGGPDTDPVGGAGRFALLYLGAALAWLFVTDWVVLHFFEDTPQLQTVKGGLFMVMSAAIVWAILYHNARQWRRHNASLHREAAFNRGLIAASPIPIVVLDTDARVVLWSPMARDVFGWESRDVENAKLPCFADDHLHWNDELWAQIRSGIPPVPFECEATRADGTSINLRVSLARLLEADGSFMGAIVMLQDVSDHREALDRVRASERRLRMLFEHNPRPMWVYDLETLCFVHVNRAAMDHYGYSESEWRSMNIFDIRPESEHERLRADLEGDRSALQRSRSWVHRKKSGELIDVNIDSHTVTIDGQPHVLVVVDDVTERNRLARENADFHEELRRMTGRLLRAQEAERRHIARELHDESGALLTALQLCLQMAGQRIRPDNEPALNELAEAEAIARELGDKIRTLSTGLLPGVLDDLGLVAGVRWLAERLHRQTGLSVELIHDLGPAERFATDIETIAYRIVQEALTNVIRHAKVSEATVAINRRDGTLEVHVIDEGEGFDMDDAALKGHIGVLGMRERCALVDGRLRVRSSPGEGTLVTAILPLAEIGQPS